MVLVESGVLGFELRNTAQGIWKLTIDWNPEFKDSGINGAGFSYMGQPRNLMRFEDERET